MGTLTEVKVPDIGDFGQVEVIEVLVNVGDRLAAEDPLITLESDKASMDVPSPTAGVVKELRVSAGDRIGEGDLILLLDADAADDDAAATAAQPATPATSRSVSLGSTLPKLMSVLALRLETSSKRFFRAGT